MTAPVHLVAFIDLSFEKVLQVLIFHKLGFHTLLPFVKGSTMFLLSLPSVLQSGCCPAYDIKLANEVLLVQHQLKHKQL